MIVRTQDVKFTIDRKPQPRRVKLGFEGDNAVERLRFALPDLGEGQTATLMMSGAYANAVTLEADTGRWSVDLTAEVIGKSGEVAAYVRTENGGDVWQSDAIMLETGKVPDAEGDIEQRYPTAVGQMLTAMEEHSGKMRESEELLDQLGAALAHTHGAQRAVAGVRVGAQDHLTAARQLLACIGVDDRLVGGDVDTAVLLGGGETEDVVILVDGAAHGAQGVVAVGHGIGNGEFLQTGGLGGLDDTHVGDVMGNEAVKLQMELAGLLPHVVLAEDLIGDGLFPVGGRGDGGRDGSAFLPECAGIM